MPSRRVFDEVPGSRRFSPQPGHGTLQVGRQVEAAGVGEGRTVLFLEGDAAANAIAMQAH